MNYELLFSDKKEGKISQDMTLMMDNDDGYWHCDNENMDEEKAEEICEKYTNKYGTPNGYNDIVAILNAAGIKADWC